MPSQIKALSTLLSFSPLSFFVTQSTDPKKGAGLFPPLSSSLNRVITFRELLNRFPKIKSLPRARVQITRERKIAAAAAAIVQLHFITKVAEKRPGTTKVFIILVIVAVPVDTVAVVIGVATLLLLLLC